MEIIRPLDKELYDEYIARILSTRANSKDVNFYQEHHHIIPRCMEGDNSKENLVWLYAQEHYYAHKLLALENPHNKKLQYAFFMMSNHCGKERTQNIHLTADEYAEERIIISQGLSGENNPMYGKKASEETKIKMHLAKLDENGEYKYKGENHPLYGTHRTQEQKEHQSKIMSQLQQGENNSMYGKKHSSASIEKMRQVHTGVKHTEATKNKMSKIMKGHEVSEATRDKISKARIGKYSGINNPGSKQVVRIENNQVFVSFTEAAEWAQTTPESIGCQIKGVYKTSGKNPETGEKLHWKLFNNEQQINFNKSVETAGNV